jgi:hypothetical protein
VHMRALFAGMLGVLLMLALLTLLVFGHMWCSPPSTELEENSSEPAVHDGILYTGCHLCLHVLSDLPVDRTSSSLIGVPYSSWYDAHFSFHSKSDLDDEEAMNDDEILGEEGFEDSVAE